MHACAHTCTCPALRLHLLIGECNGATGKTQSNQLPAIANGPGTKSFSPATHRLPPLHVLDWHLRLGSKQNVFTHPPSSPPTPSSVLRTPYSRAIARNKTGTSIQWRTEPFCTTEVIKTARYGSDAPPRLPMGRPAAADCRCLHIQKKKQFIGMSSNSQEAPHPAGLRQQGSRP